MLSSQEWYLSVELLYVNIPQSCGVNSVSDKNVQYDRFKEAACALSCDEDEKAFDVKLAEVAKHKLTAATEPEKK